MFKKTKFVFSLLSILLPLGLVSCTGETGQQGIQGETGVSIVSIVKTGTNGNVDTYTITMSDGTTYQFIVTNGKNGEQGIQGEPGKDGHTPVITIGSNGNWYIDGVDSKVAASSGPKGDKGDKGEKGDKGDSGVSIISIVKTATNGNVDTYTITMSDGTTYQFTVTNGEDGEQGIQGEVGKDGLTPYIGGNGNWWIGDTDTGIKTDYSEPDRKITDNLGFAIRTINGKAGIIVNSYTGTDTDIVIPDYVGSVPVIGVDEEAFSKNETITSVSLSYNTVYLARCAFGGCKALTSFNFNDCPITTIPEYCFSGTGLTDVVLPSTVTKLERYAFYKSYLNSINYENITYFGDDCLETTNIDYFYLKSSVDYVGESAFLYSFVYIQDVTTPSTWATHISSMGFKTGCIKGNEYIYSLNEANEATIYQYLSDSKTINVPSTIDTYAVKTIGTGFCSSSYFEESDTTNFKKLNEVVIPSSVTTIEGTVFYGVKGTMVYVPSSVTEISSSAVVYSYLNYYCFEADAIPMLSEKDNQTFYRYSTGVNYSNLVYDEGSESYFIKENTELNMMAYMGVEKTELTIPSQVNNVNINSINKYAIFKNPNLTGIIIESGIRKIKSYAIQGELSYIYIPSSVTIINAYGVDSSIDCYLVQASGKPSEWDSYWNSTTSSKNITYDFDISQNKFSDGFTYEVENGMAYLIHCFKTSSTPLYLPRTIEGIEVVGIRSDFISYSSTKDIYIPQSIVTIESKAFTSTNYSYTYFYLEASTKPKTWATDFYYSSYYANSTSRVSYYYSQTFNY